MNDKLEVLFCTIMHVHSLSKPWADIGEMTDIIREMTDIIREMTDIKYIRAVSCNIRSPLMKTLDWKQWWTLGGAKGGASSPHLNNFYWSFSFEKWKHKKF